jgi:hypothetical protein
MFRKTFAAEIGVWGGGAVTWTSVMMLENFVAVGVSFEVRWNVLLGPPHNDMSATERDRPCDLQQRILYCASRIERILTGLDSTAATGV